MQAPQIVLAKERKRARSKSKKVMPKNNETNRSYRSWKASDPRYILNHRKRWVLKSRSKRGKEIYDRLKREADAGLRPGFQKFTSQTHH